MNSTVVVTVRDGAGAPLANRDVMALWTNGTIQAWATSNASGLATFSLPANSYRFRVQEDDSNFDSGAAGHCVTPACTTATITITRVDVTVVDTGGAPLVGHLIWWETPQGADGGYVETDASGHAIISTAAGSYRFVDVVNGYDFASGPAGHCVVPGCTAVTITETIPIAVTVTNTAGVPQANLTVGWEDAVGETGGDVDTNANGVATLSVPAAGSYRFVVWVGGNEFASGPANHCVVPGCTSAQITISAPVTVTVRDTAGAPIAGRPVVWENGVDEGPNVNTNASGVATLVPPLEAVRFRVTVAEGTQFFSGPSVHCSQPACTSATITVSQQTVVTVVDGSGNPISGRAVTPLRNDGSTGGNKTTNASGQATFRLPFEPWRFRATCSGSTEQFFSGNAGHCFIPGCVTARITMPCGQCTGQANGTVCNDQNPCTGSSTCQSQKCTGASPVTCSASDQCHDAGACTALTATTSTCSNPAKADGTTCNDNDACTQTSTCQAGVCTGENPVTCTASDQCHDAGTCNPATGICSNPNKANGTACNDNDLCTQSDSCQAGACMGANPVTCAAQDQCHVAGTCNPATGVCSASPRAVDGTGCSVGNRCSTGDSCRAGTCLPGPTYTCTVAEQPKYVSVIELGSGQGSSSYATGLNNSGVVVGMDGSRGFRWSASEGLVYVPGAEANTYAVAINDAGVMAAGTATYLPCRYDPAVDPQPVCQPGEGRSSGINAAGTVTGWTVTGHYSDNFPITSMIRLGAGSLEILPPVPNPGNRVNALGSWIDGDGTVVGRQDYVGAIRYRAGRGTEVLHDLLPSGSNNNFLYHASFIRSGEILGWAGWYPEGHQRAYRIKTNSTGDVTAIDKLPLPSPYLQNAPNISSAEASNASGTIVGTVYDPSMSSVEAAFVYTDLVGAINLNDLIDPDSHWTLLSSAGINDNGEVVGYGTHDGAVRAFKLTLPELGPCPPTDSCHTGVRDILTGVCSYVAKPNGTACDDGNACTTGDVCSAGVCQGPAAFSCTAPDTCHGAGTCSGAAPSPPPPSTQDLIGWWKLDGNGADASGGGHNLTVEGNVTTAPGRVGMGMKFDGSSCMTTPIWNEALMQGANGVTMMAWIRPDSAYTVSSQTPQAVMGRGWDYSAGTYWYPNGGIAPVVGARPVGATTWGYPGGGSNATPDQWTHVALIWDRSDLIIYHNGKRVISYPNAGAFGDIDPTFAIGCMVSYYFTGDDRIAHFHGAVDEAMLYRRVLSPSEIAAYYAAADPCQHPVFADNTACNDGNLCTQTDTCQAGTCVGANPITCVADACHTAGTCVSSTGVCSNLARPEGAVCNDGQACTQSEVCQAGSCLPPPGASPPVLNLAVDDVGAAGTFGGSYSNAADINASGQIVGSATNTAGEYHSFLRTGSGPMVDFLPQLESGASSINDYGAVTGSMKLPGGSSRGYLFVDGTNDDLGLIGDDLPATDVFQYQGVYASDINGFLQVAGSYTDQGTLYGFRYEPDFGFTPIGSLEGGMTRASAISAGGTVVGSSWVAGTPETTGVRRLGHAIMFNNSIEGIRDLNSYVNPADWTLISATDIAGNYVVGSGDYHGVVRAYRLNLATYDIVPLSGGWEGETYGTGVNESGDVVGWGTLDAAGNQQAAFVYTDSLGFKKLNDMIDLSGGWDLRVANAINRSGEIVGWGYLGGQVSAFQLSLPTGYEATCGSRNICGGENDPVCLFADGVIETSPGHFVAVFGYENASPGSLHPAINQVRIDGSVLQNPQPPPPADLSPGIHAGVFFPPFEDGQTISWTVNGQTVTARSSSPRLSGGVIPTLLGIANDSAGVTKAIFTYSIAGASNVVVPYGPSNSLSNEGGFIASPPELPPQEFVTGAHPPFIATLGPNHLTWTVADRSATATSQSPQLPVTTLPDGTRVATLPDGRKLNLDSVPPQDPVPRSEPQLGARFYGALAGKLSVAASGAAIYTLPISVPPGINGMAPNLSLVYNSQAGNGLAGDGWELAGLSMIHRCPKTRVQDGSSRPITMGSFEPIPPGVPVLTGFQQTFDVLCIDGKRMFQKEDGTYHLEAEDFSVITAHNDNQAQVTPLWFTVLTKNGEKRYYGLHQKDRVQFPHSDSVHGTTTETAIWALDRVIDAWGNYYDVHYNDDQADFTTRGLIVTKIDYTGHFATSRNGGDSYQAAFPPFHSITFGYNEGNRPDVRRLRFGDVTLPKVKRLTSITTPAGTYRLSYLLDVDAMLPSRMNRIDFCAPSGAPCLDPLIFGWDFSGYGWAPQPSPQSAGGQDKSYVLPAAIDSETVCDVDQNPICQPKAPGTQFVDLDADGRVDLVKSIATSDEPNIPQTSLAWLNNGHGWEGDNNMALPAGLVDAAGKSLGTTFADIDGDGLIDLVSRERRLCECLPGHTAPPCTVGQIQSCNVPRKPVVYYNRRFSWVADTGLFGSPSGASTYPVSTWGGIDFASGKDQLADVNGDGRADIVRVTGPQDFDESTVRVLINTPDVGWVEDTQTHYSLPVVVFQAPEARPARFLDVNRDGLADVLTRSGAVGLINMGVNGGPNGTGSVWGSTFAAPGNYKAVPGLRFVGDVDGDGYHDSVSLYESVNSPVNTGIFLSAGGLGYTTAGAEPYLSSLSTFEPPHSQYTWANMAMTDLNGDGLADLVMGSPLSHNTAVLGPTELLIGDSLFIADPGNVLINTGTNWQPYNPVLVGPVPIVPVDVHAIPNDGLINSSNGAAFVDVNGDGLPDLVWSSSVANIHRTWLNTFRPPVITAFPNGVSPKSLAQSSQVTYETITTGSAKTNGVYSEVFSLQAGTTYMTPPIRVVASVSMEDGLGTGEQAKTSYSYSGFRGSRTGRGPQGFQTILARDERRGINVSTTYAQAFPYTGLPTTVTRYKPGQQPLQFGTTISRTETIYCDTTVDLGQGPLCSPMSGATSDPPATSRFVYPIVISDYSFPPIGTGPAVMTTNSQFRYDLAGNVIKTLVRTSSKTGEMYEKSTVNDYASEQTTNNTIPLRLGKLTRSTVTSQRLAPAGGPSTLVQQVTEFDYAIVGAYSDAGAGGQNNAIPAMIKRRIEPNADQNNETTRNTELHTAYDHDGVGNVVMTKDCATDFGNCDRDPTHLGPPELPFRTTTVSFNPADFRAPAQGQGLISAVTYEPGRFPVKTTNAVGHEEYSAFDPVTGALRQKTDPNGLTICYAPDPFGHPESETARCGSDSPLTTTTRQYRNIASDIPLATVVAVTRAPTGDVTWTYSDVLGRKISTRRRGFDGRFIEATTGYDPKGRATSETKPHFLGDPVYAANRLYDPLGRVDRVTQALGQIVTGPPASSSLVNTYQDLTTHIDETVGGTTRRRSETKNALGKVASMTERVYDLDPGELGAHDATIAYAYDGAGNLRFTTDPIGNVVEMQYDVRGRKTKTIDPDIGTWKHTYNGFGDLVSETDAKNRTTTMTYDRLGRLVSRADGQGNTAYWIYDAEPGGVGAVTAMISAPDSRLSGTCSIPHLNVSGEGRSGRSFKYTKFGEVKEVTDCVEGNTFVTTYTYDSRGRQSLVEYPAVNEQRRAVSYHYTSLGYLHYLGDESEDYSVLWQATSMNALAQVVGEVTRNGVETISTRNAATGWMMATSSTAHRDGNKVIQNWGFGYDEAGNVLTRARVDIASPSPSTETFKYDSLNRLRSSIVTIGQQQVGSESFDYDDIGNLMQKNNQQYTYGSGCQAGMRPAGPHAVCTVGVGSPYSYDDNGNMIVGGGRSIDYNDLHKATHMQGPGGQVDFIYGADNNRVVQDTGVQGERTIYVGLGPTGRSLYERTAGPDGTKHVQFIYAGQAHGGNPFALRILAPSGSTTATKYYSFDHLGSVTAMSDETGHVETSGAGADVLGYDAWGARRNPDGSAANPASFTLHAGHREFTGHETIPNLGLVNMNGRVYDPILGRFLSPDPNIQFSANLQSYNRYSYVLNNPLRSTDPTGFLLDEQFGVSGLDMVVGAVLSVGSTAICVIWGPVSGGATCVAGAAIMAAWRSAVMSAEGASFGQIVVINGVAMFVGAVSGGVADAAGGSLAAQMVSGAVSNAASYAISTAVMGGDLSLTDLLDAVAQDALMSGFAWGFSSLAVSQASAEAQGGGGSGEARARRPPGTLVAGDDLSVLKDKDRVWMNGNDPCIGDYCYRGQHDGKPGGAYPFQPGKGGAVPGPDGVHSHLRLPDYLQLSVSGGGVIGGSFSVTLSRYGDVYLTPGGGSGKSAMTFSGNLTLNWFETESRPQRATLHGFLEGGSYSFGFGHVLGLSGAMNSSGSSTGVGLFAVPQLGGGYGYSFPVTRLHLEW